jgi:hypothetical protein
MTVLSDMIGQDHEVFAAGIIVRQDAPVPMF